jgi:Plasmid pRiA4b ORF-3-like protein
MSRPRGGAPRIYAYTFRVRILDGPYAPPDDVDIWREIELRGDQTLADLGDQIVAAFDFDDEHLWSFFLSGRAWDASTAYTAVEEDEGRPAERLRIRHAPAGKEFMFLYDYGDEWRLGVKLARTGEIEPGADYPRVVASHGQAPPQYGAEDDDDWDEEDDEEEQAYQQEREWLLERFQEWAERRGVPDDTWFAPALLDYKWEDADGEITRWTADDLRDLLQEWCPRTMAVPEDKIGRVIPSARVFLQFLDDTELLDPDGDQHGALDATLDWIEPGFEAAMRDTSRFTPVKAALQAMQDEGVDLEDFEGVDRFLAGFEIPEEISRADEAVEAPAFPPVALPSPDELRAEALAAPVPRRLRELAEWTGQGRKLTAKGTLGASDRQDLAATLGLTDPAGADLALAWAREVGLVRSNDRRLVRVARAEGLLEDPLELFERAFQALPAIGEEVCPKGLVDAAFPGGLADAIADILSALYASGEPVEVEGIAGHIWEEHVAELVDADPMRQVLARAEVDSLLATLHGLGMTAEVSSEDGEPAIRLTPLGVWKTNGLLRATGAEAPVIGDLADVEVEELIEGVAAYDEEACRAELRCWCQRRGERAARELAAYARAATRFEHQMLAFVALEEDGPGAEAEVRAMLDNQALRPQAQMWLVRNGFEDKASLDPAAPTLLMAETLATILQADGPASLVEQVEGLGPPAEQIAMLEDVAHAPTPRIVGVLDAIAKAHPVPEVAKSARKAALKLRSPGAGR